MTNYELKCEKIGGKDDFVAKGKTKADIEKQLHKHLMKAHKDMAKKMTKKDMEKMDMQVDKLLNKQIPKTRLRQQLTFHAKPEEVYEMLLNPKKVTKFTRSKAVISQKVGGEVSMFGGSIEGKNLELIKNKKIVQTWHTNSKNWPEKYDSKVTFSIKKIKGGTRLNFTHSLLPKSEYKNIEKGWNENYFMPMKEALA